MKKYDVLLFDADDTLLDFKSAEKCALYAALADVGVICDADMAAEYSKINMSLWKQLERGEVKKPELRTRRFELFCEKYKSDADYRVLADCYTERLSEQSQTVSDAVEICRELSAEYRMYIITNGLKCVQEKRFAGSGLAGFFIGEFISEDIGFDKPNIEYFNEIERKIPGFDRRRALIIGDSPTSDIAGGINAGIDTCWISDKSSALPSGISANYRISSLCELRTILL